MLQLIDAYVRAPANEQRWQGYEKKAEVLREQRREGKYHSDKNQTQMGIQSMFLFSFPLKKISGIEHFAFLISSS